MSPTTTLGAPAAPGGSSGHDLCDRAALWLPRDPVPRLRNTVRPTRASLSGSRSVAKRDGRSARWPFERHGDPLAAADAQGDEAARQAVALHRVQ